MKKTMLCFAVFFSIFNCDILAQGTFSMVAVDTATGEVGSAGGSCVDYIFYNLVPGRIGDPIPGKGAINTQAATNLTNQANARTRMLAGDSPKQIIDWLKANDVQGDSTIRQYGIVDLNQGNPRTAAFTGSNCSNYKNHILGPNYSIQGNILLGQQILDSMEVRFNAEQGSLACKLMAALQGAKQVGADSRCVGNGTSALYAYVKVAQTNDSLDNPSLNIGVRTADNAGIEPIDSVQALFDQMANCWPIGISDHSAIQDVLIYPNPANNFLTIKLAGPNSKYVLYDLLGRGLIKGETDGKSINLSSLNPGCYILRINDHQTFKVIKQ